MIQDFFLHRCDTYRIQGFGNYDFSPSSEGEVTEVWGIVALDIPSRFEPEDGAFQRRADGVVDVGDHKLFVGPEVNIQNADRVYRALGEIGPDFYEVTAVSYIRDMHDQLHHKEVRCSHIDWVAPTETVMWVPTGTAPNIVVNKITFDFRDGDKALVEVLLGYWLKSIAIQIIVPFDDPSADLSIADSTETLVPNGLMDLTVAGNYDEVTISKQYSFNDPVILTLDPGASTQGSGVIFTQVIIQ